MRKKGAEREMEGLERKRETEREFVLMWVSKRAKERKRKRGRDIC
jgi:hypothetical protein